MRVIIYLYHSSNFTHESRYQDIDFIYVTKRALNDLSQTESRNELNLFDGFKFKRTFRLVFHSTTFKITQIVICVYFFRINRRFTCTHSPYKISNSMCMVNIYFCFQITCLTNDLPFNLVCYLIFFLLFIVIKT